MNDLAIAVRDIAPEFAGKARAFRDKIAASDAAVVPRMEKIGRDAHAICRRRPTFRKEALAGFEHGWRQLQAGRLQLEVERSRGTLKMRDLRLASGEIMFRDWEAPEASISLVLVQFVARPGHMLAENHLLASIGLHALARRFQRGFDVSESAIQEDLLHLAKAAGGLIEAGGLFRQPAADGGVWLGRVAFAQLIDGSMANILSVRTYV